MQSHGANFRCPICRATVFRPVTVRRLNGQYHQTEFFECGGCTVMFRDPVRFTAHVPPPENVIRAPEFARLWGRRSQGD